MIVANKHDLLEADEDSPFALYQQIGYHVLPTSTATGEGIETLRELLRGKLSALTGPRGQANPACSMRCGPTWSSK